MTRTAPEGASLPDGAALHEAVRRLVAIPRSLSGDGVRATLAALDGMWAGMPPMAVHEVPSGTEVFDWTVPDEWRLRRATLTGPDGRIIADTDDHPLAVVGYSEPVDVRLQLEELQAHLHSVPEQPDAIPYRTSYYAPGWGFCLPDRIRRALPEGTYHAVVDADLSPGHLTYGELVIPGSGDGAGLISAHTCHPGMANDNASGMAVATALAAHLAATPRRLTWHVVLAPGTIGSLMWLHRNPQVWPRGRAGFVLAGVGDAGPLVPKRTRRGDTLADRALQVALRDLSLPDELRAWTPWGYDERQYGSLGFDLPVALVQRTPHGTYPEYHTSLDDPSFVRAESLEASLAAVVAAVGAVEANGTWRNTAPHGEPQLGKRGLYPSTGGRSARTAQLAMLWLLGTADGATDLLAVAERSGIALRDLAAAADALSDAGLLAAVDADG